MKYITKALPEGECDICHRMVKDLDLYLDERRFVCQSCSQRIQNGEFVSEPVRTYEIEGLASIEKRVTAGSKTSGRIYLPQDWIGGWVVAILVESPIVYTEEK